eukprot:scaffold71244_cov65-Phaeocystis_antarctica.AAC.4
MVSVWRRRPLDNYPPDDFGCSDDDDFGCSDGGTRRRRRRDKNRTCRRTVTFVRTHAPALGTNRDRRGAAHVLLARSKSDRRS